MEKLRKISINPITRLEGHGKIDIFLDEEGSVADSHLIVPELRGFEKFIEGRPVEELPRITSRICGVCPEAHHTASAKTVDAVYGIDISETAELIRRLQYNAFVAGDHATHFFALGGPDFIIGPDAPQAERNVIGVIKKVGVELGRRVIRMRKEAHEVSSMLGGRPIHPVGMIAGGQSKSVTREMQTRLIEIGQYLTEFSLEVQNIFSTIVLEEKRYLDLILSEAFSIRTNYMALVNDMNQSDVYDGHVRIVDPEGHELARFKPCDYLDHIAEKVVPWTYLKFPYFKGLGWKGIVDGEDSGIYRTGPLGMLNASLGMQTPYAQAEYEKFFETLGGKPVHATLAYHWARIIEMLQCSELMLSYARDERLTSPNVRSIPTSEPSEGVGCVEAPRGMLFHHYTTDSLGIVQRANLIVGTGNNHASLQLSIKKAASSIFRRGEKFDEGMLNQIEMAFRAYDPCFGCATHALPGHMPMEVRVFDHRGQLAKTVHRGLSLGSEDSHE